jgi:hypothetical protein
LEYLFDWFVGKSEAINGINFIALVSCIEEDGMDGIDVAS